MVDSDFSLPYPTLIHMITIKLTSANYLLWRNQVETLLTSQDLFGYLDGSIPTPPSSSADVAVQKALKDWLAQDQRLHSLLLSSLTEESMAETLGCKSDAAVWTALEKAYSLRSKTREIQLNDELQHLRRGNDSVTVYSTKFRSYCDQLTAIGSPVSETNKLHWYCQGLGPLFSTFSLSQMRLLPAPTLPDVISEAESYYLFQKSMEDSQPAPVAFVANNGPNSRNNQRGGRSHGNSSFSGVSRSSNARGSSNNTNSGRRNNRRPYVPHCQICKTDGHYAADCPDRYARSTISAPQAHLASAFNAMNIQSEDASDWYMDSGASSHMTSNTSQLDSATPYNAQENTRSINRESVMQ